MLAGSRKSSLAATFDEILDALARVQKVRLDGKGIPFERITEPPPLAHAIFRALGIRPCRGSARSAEQLHPPNVAANPKDRISLSISSVWSYAK
jgi:hypothetical protein